MTYRVGEAGETWPSMSKLRTKRGRITAAAGALVRIFQVLRPGQEPKAFDVTVVIEPEEEKAKYQTARRVEPEPEPAPAKAAGYTPI
jgi:hypothetical protein